MGYFQQLLHIYVKLLHILFIRHIFLYHLQKKGDDIYEKISIICNETERSY